MFRWLHPYAFLAWALAIAVLKLTNIPEDGISPEWIGATAGAIIGGGLFWGAISTLLYNNYFKK